MPIKAYRDMRRLYILLSMPIFGQVLGCSSWRIRVIYPLVREIVLKLE